jgi:hypothetical protein
MFDHDMDWQKLTALGIVAATAALFLRNRFRPRKFSFARDTHCGCAGRAAAPNHSVVFHARKGQRPEIVVKMK